MTAVAFPPTPRELLASAGVLDFARNLAHRHRVSLDDVLGASRSASVVRARHELWSITRDTLGLSSPELGRLFGVDHTTVLSGVRKYRAWRGLP